MAPFVAFYS